MWVPANLVTHRLLTSSEGDAPPARSLARFWSTPREARRRDDEELDEPGLEVGKLAIEFFGRLWRSGKLKVRAKFIHDLTLSSEPV